MACFGRYIRVGRAFADCMSKKTKAIIDKCLRERLVPILKEEGYRKVRHDFTKDDGVSIRRFWVQHSPYNFGSTGEFTFNLSVELTPLRRLLTENFPPSVDVRIGDLMPCKNDYWWKVSSRTSTRRLGRELCDTWTRYAKPWLDRYCDVGEFLRYCRRTSDYVLAAAIYLHRGKTREAQKFAEKEILSLQWNDTCSELRRWIRRVGLSMNQRMNAHVKTLPTYDAWNAARYAAENKT